MTVRKRCACADPYHCAHGYHAIGQVNGKDEGVSIDRWLKRRGDTRKAATKTDAEKIAPEIEAWILAGKPAAVAAAPAAASTAITFAELGEKFTKYLDATEREASANEASNFRVLGRQTLTRAGVATRVATLPIDTLTSDEIEELYGAVTRGLANSSKRKYRQTLTRALNLAVRKKWIAASPITAETTLAAGKGAMRQRRVLAAEEAELLQAASEGRIAFAAARLVAMIIAAIESGLRLGELLALQWRDVHVDPAGGERGRLDVRAEEAGARKTGIGRKAPLSSRLAGYLAPLRTAPAGGVFGPLAYVFGDEIGERVKSVRKAWDTAVLRAHKLEPVWTKSGGSLATASRVAFAKIDLEFRDLRHEAALRWYDGGRGLGLNEIASMLGHSDLSMLRIYLGITQDAALEAFAKRLEAQAAPTPPAPAAEAKKSPLVSESRTKVVQNGVLRFAPRQRKTG